jgi:hypothetical protein
MRTHANIQPCPTAALFVLLYPKSPVVADMVSGFIIRRIRPKAGRIPAGFPAANVQTIDRKNRSSTARDSTRLAAGKLVPFNRAIRELYAQAKSISRPLQTIKHSGDLRESQR